MEIFQIYTFTSTGQFLKYFLQTLNSDDWIFSAKKMRKNVGFEEKSNQDVDESDFASPIFKTEFSCSLGAE